MNTTRRSLLAAAAWSVPAVTIAAATPAYARSTTPTPPTASCLVAAAAIRRPGKSKGRPWVYLVEVDCTKRVDFVLVNGRPARKPRPGSVYAITLPALYDTVTVSVVTRGGGTVSKVVAVR